MSRKAVTVAVAAATIAWSIGLAALVAPLAASAATPAGGSLIKASLPAVYYMGNDGKRYVFPNEKTYKTWYADFSGVMTITDAELAAIPIGGNVTYKPGVKMVKITTDPKVYAVDAHGTLRWVNSESAAVSLYGSDWNTKIDDIPDAFFTNYSLGADIASASDFSPAAVSSAATSINTDKGLGGGSVVSGVSVSLASDGPTAATVPQGAQGVNAVKANISNNSGSAVTLSSVTVMRSGPGTTADFSNLYLYSGAERLTTGRTLNSSTNDATFSGLNLEIANGSSTSLWVAADFAIPAPSNAGNVDSLSISSVMVGGNSAAGTPVAGPNFTIASATVGAASIAPSGTLSNIKAGGMSEKVAEFQLTAPSTEDVDLHSVAIFYSGTAGREDLSNLTLKQGGLTLATASAISSKDLATFSFATPMYMEKGAQRTFEVYADISANARSGETVGFYLDQATDVKIVGRTYGFGVGVNSTWNAAATASIEAGKLTASFNGPAAKNIPSNGKDVELYNFTIAAQSNLEFRQTDFVVTVDVAGNCALIDDFKLVDTSTGAIIAGPVDLANVGGTANICDVSGAAANDIVSRTETWTLNAGQTRTLKVTADIDSTMPNDATIKVQLGAAGALFGANKVRNLDNSTYLVAGDMVPSGVIAGNTHTVKTPSLTTSVSSTPVGQTYIQGTQGVSLLGVTLKAGDASDIKVSSLRVTGFIDDNNGNADILQGQDLDVDTATISDSVLSLKLWNGSTQVGDTESPGSGTDGTAVFDSLNITVPAGGTVSLLLTGNLASSIASVVTTSDLMRWDVVAAGDVTATDPDGNTVPATGTATGNVMTIAGAGSLTLALAPDDSESEAGLLVGGTSNAVLAKYKFTAANEELKLTKVRLTTGAPTGVTSMSLYDGSTLVGGPISVDGSGNADFSSVNFVIPKDGSKSLTVKGNLNSVGSSGATTGSDVMVTLGASNFEVRGTGAGSNTLITSIDPSATQATGTVTLSGNGVAAEADTVTVNGVLLTEGIEFNYSGADIANATSLAAAIDAISGVSASSGGTAVVTITADVYGTDGNAITLAAVDVSGGGGALAVSGATLGGATGLSNVPANAKILRKSKPTVTPVALPTTTLSAGDQVVLRFTVAADAAGDVAFAQLQGSVTPSGAVGVTAAALGGSLKLVGGSWIPCSAAAWAGNVLTITLTNEEVVAAGTSKTYEVYATMAGAGANDSVTSKLQSDTVGGTTNLAGQAASNFVWSDMSIVGHSPTTVDWTDGLYVKNLPTDSQTLVK